MVATLSKREQAGRQRPWQYLVRSIVETNPADSKTSNKHDDNEQHAESTLNPSDENALAMLSLAELRRKASEQGIDTAKKLSRAKLIELLSR
ncbi:hypothetical protein [Cyanobium sp. ATX 6F1]|uniref:hypothetical protein n=1 Tax=unclassified Cyanobium TaxID=2627006 RepID=UPI0020CCD118|nr:hypothetical protein [Cyanobium sp. ATX 6F1]MCP9917205.1 hypothetical protein [Cyanobium sp. ATX 6F1]